MLLSTPLQVDQDLKVTFLPATVTERFFQLMMVFSAILLPWFVVSWGKNHPFASPDCTPEVGSFLPHFLALSQHLERLPLT
jgi:hypothetical protein